MKIFLALLFLMSVQVFAQAPKIEEKPDPRGLGFKAQECCPTCPSSVPWSCLNDHRVSGKAIKEKVPSGAKASAQGAKSE